MAPSLASRKLNVSNSILAKHTVYTHDKSVEETGEEVLAILGLDAPQRDEGFNDKSFETLWSKEKNFLPPFA